MKREVVQSTNIREVGYDPEQELLEILFANGGLYQYHKVPQSLVEEMLKAESIGSFFGKNIRNGGFNFDKLPEPTPKYEPVEREAGIHPEGLRARFLELVVDEYSLKQVLEALSTISYAKAQHIIENWQDKTEADKWLAAADLVDMAARRVGKVMR